MSGTLKVRAVAAVLAGVPVIGSLFVGLFIFVLLSVPWENSEPLTGDQKLWVGLFITGTAVAFALALLQLVSIATGYTRLAFVAFVSHMAAATVLLWLALGESQHSDDILLGYFAAVELAALAAVAIAALGRESSETG